MSLLQHGSSLQRVLDAVPDEVAILDASGRIEFTNHAWQRFARENGLRGDASSVGVDYVAVIQSGPDAQGVGEAVREVLSGAHDGFRWTYPCHSPSKQHWFEMKVGRLTGGGAVIVHTEVTDRIAVEDTRRRLAYEQRQRQSLQEERGRLQSLLNEVSHDIATPLTPLMMRIDLLRKDRDLPQGVQEHLDAIHSMTQRLRDGLLRFQGHLDDTLSGDEQTTTSVEEFLAEHRPAWESLARQYNLHLHIELPSVGLAIPASTLEFIMASLLDEGVRMAPLDGSIQVSGAVKNHRCHFKIVRTGPAWDLADHRLLDDALAVHGSHIELDQDTVRWSVALAAD